jgi:hypothetical protein
MASTSSFPSLVSHRTPVIIVLAGSIAALGPHWRDCISSCTDPLVKRLSEENYSHPVSLHSAQPIGLNLRLLVIAPAGPDGTRRV